MPYDEVHSSQNLYFGLMSDPSSSVPVNVIR